MDALQLLQTLSKEIVYTPGRGASLEGQKRLLELLKRYEELRPYSGMEKWFVPNSPYSIEACPKHRDFFAAGALYRERLFSFSNRSGKSVSGAFELACHATGLYPSWWTGRRFTKPIRAWAIADRSETTRDVCQKELYGDIGSPGTGMIPAKLIVDKRSMPGVPNALSNLLVRHVSGGVSSIGFKSYKQGEKSFYGTAIDVAWCDEEPLDLQLYSEIVTRTMTTDGIVYTTSTPLAGMTPFVESFEKHADFIGDSHPCISRDFYIDPDGKTSKAIIRGGWDHVPWLSEDAKREILAATPENLRDARSKGIPAVGEQNVYALTWDQISVPSFPIPEHYRCWYGLDVGGNTAACFFAEDPDTSTIYLYDEYVGKQQPPVIHAYAIKERGAWMHGAVDPHAGDTNSSGEKVLEIYRNLGLNLRKANNAVEGGLTEVWNLLSVGKLKIFDRCRQLRGEYSKYRRDKDGKVVKKDDHLMDAMRYGIVTGRRLAERQPGKGAVNGRAKSRYDAIR